MITVCDICLHLETSSVNGWVEECLTVGLLLTNTGTGNCLVTGVMKVVLLPCKE